MVLFFRQIHASLLVLSSLASCGRQDLDPARSERPKPTLGIPEARALPDHSQDEKDAPARRTEQPLSEVRSAILAQDYAKTETLLRALPEDLAALPEVQLARALAEFELKKFYVAFETLDALSSRDLTFVKEVRELREKIVLGSRDARLARLHFGDRSDLLALVRRAQFEQEAGHHEEAERLVELALKQHQKAQKGQALLAEAYLLRASLRMARGLSREALADYREVLVRFPLTKGAEAGQEALAAAPAKEKLKLSDYEKRADFFGKRGLPAKIEQDLAVMKKDLGIKSPPLKFQIALAFARFHSRRDQRQAAAEFQRLALRGDDRSGEYLYYRARALARAYEIDAAVDAYDKASRKKGPFAEKALYQAARLLAIDGRPAEATERYRRYLARYGKKAASGKEATFGAALTSLALGASDAAIKHLSELERETKDPRGKALLLELTGIAHSSKERKQEAAIAFSTAIQLEPFSLPASFARTRLALLGEPGSELPRGPAPPRSDESFVFELPSRAARLQKLGLNTWAEGALRESEAEVRRTYGARGDEALCAMYGSLGTAERRYQVAQTAAKSEVLHRLPTESEVWQWHCAFPRPYEADVERASKEHKTPKALIYAVMRQESAFRPAVVSPAGAVGLMQLMPETARQIGKHLGRPDPSLALRLPSENISYGAYYLSHLLDHFSGNLVFAVAAYNAGPNAVKSWLTTKKKPPLDIFAAQIPFEETRNYVYRVLANFARYSYLETGDPGALQLALEIDIDAETLPSTY